MVCKHCTRRIWFWQARYTLEYLDAGVLVATFRFHGECACDWLMSVVNANISRFAMRKV